MRASDLLAPFSHPLRALETVGRLALGLTLLGSLALASPSRATSGAQTSQPSLVALELALRERIMGFQPHPLARQQKEKAQLSAALRNLIEYEGRPESFSAPDREEWPGVVADLRTLARVAFHIHRSKTPDADILFHVTAIRNTVDRLGVEVRQVALTSVSLLLSEDVEEAVVSLVDKGDVLRSEGLERWPVNFGQGASRLGLAADHQHEAALLADQTVQLEAVMFPVDVVPGEVRAPSVMPGANSPFELDVQIERINRRVPELTVAVRALSMDRVFTAGGPQPLSQSTIGVKTMLDVQPGERLPPITVEVPPFEDEILVTHTGTDLGNIAGRAVDIDGDTAVVGAPWCCSSKEPGPSFVSVLERYRGGIDAWGETARLEIPARFAPPINDSEFGAAVAIQGDTIVVGAPGHDAFPGGAISGAAFVFQRNESEWDFVARLAPAREGPSQFQGDRFGAAVDVSGDRIVVGAPFYDRCNDGCAGAAYVFERDEGGPDAWGLTAAFDEGGYSFGLEVGAAVAIDGDLLVLGAPDTQEFQAQEPLVRIYGHDGTTWVPEEVREGPPRSEFGRSVAVDAATGSVVVGAPGFDSLGPQDAGTVHLYQRIEDCDGVPGLICYFLAKELTAPSPFAGDRFGTSVALSRTASPQNQLLVVGSPGHDHPVGGPQDAGSIYVYVRGHAPGCPDPIPQPGGWGLLARRVSDLPVPFGDFGRAVAVSSLHASEVTIDGQPMEIDVPPTILVGEPGSNAVVGERPDAFERSGAAHLFNGMDPVMAGSYQLAIEVDPHQRVLEMDGEEAESNNIMIVPTPVQVCVPALDQANLAVTAVELVPFETDMSGETTGFIIADASGEQISPAGINVTVDMTGAFDGPIRGAQLRALLRFQGSTTEIPAWILNPATGRFESDFFVLPDISSGESASVHMEVQFDGPALPPNMNFLADLEVEVSSLAMDVEPGDDVLVRAAQNWTTVDLTGCNRASTYGKQMGNDDFNINMGFDGSLAVVSSDPALPGHDISPQYPGQEHGAVASLNASLGFAVFGRAVDDVVAFDALVERDPLYFHPTIGTGYGFFEVSLKALDFTLYSAGPVDSFTVLPPATLPTGFALLYESPDPPPGELPIGFEFTKTFSKAKTYPARDKNPCCLPTGGTLLLTEPECCTLGGRPLDANDPTDLCLPHPPTFGPCKRVPRLGRTFFPGGFPVDVDAAAEGTLGLTLGVKVADDLTLDITPFIGLGVLVDVAIPGGSPFQAGVRGAITLIRYDHIRTSGLGMTVPEPEQEGNVTICTTECFQITHLLTSLSGRIQAFAVYPWFKFFLKLTSKKTFFDIVNWPPLISIPIPEEPICDGPCTLFVKGFEFCDRLPAECNPSPCDQRAAAAAQGSPIPAASPRIR